MTRKYTTQHHRTISMYAVKNKGARRDRYGKFREGFRLSPDIINGRIAKK